MIQIATDPSNPVLPGIVLGLGFMTASSATGYPQQLLGEALARGDFKSKLEDG